MKKSKLEKSRNRWGIVFILPQLISLVCLGIIPIVIAFVLSFFDWNGFSSPVFTGFQNFKAVFTDPDTGIAIKNTLIYSVIYVPCSIALSLGLAMLLNKAWGKMFYRAVFFLPQIVTSVGIAVVWSWIYQPQFGILNMILRFFGIEGKEWLRDPSTAMGAVIVMSIWWGLGYNIVLFLAGLQNVPKTYVDAAKIDGANERQVFFNITIPLISPTTLLVTITTMINAFQVFDQMFLLTSGGPAKKTYTMAIHIYQTAFKSYELGKASTAALILFFVVVAVSVIQFKLSDKWVHYG
ncbi:carbohydrate ABC transporter permease [Blautia producta]|uniref:Lactose transport system permease protein LacF n=1 Tax=Blautia producta TaxID=33035 RepID=A0A4P6LXQ8_9FIRM|nr:sugar ABC transporter permease [Blautia producta]QBE95677.1 Lactose transport system permease protein LacF [Blautia producta]